MNRFARQCRAAQAVIDHAYHFVADKLRDGRPIPTDGEWLVHDGKPVMCESGLHASWHPFDALQFAPGGTLCLVEVEEVTAEQDDKLVCKRRKIIQRIDAEPILRDFARWCALQVIQLWDAPEVVREYLTTGDESLRAAASAAARAAASAAARAAASAAARDAARAAARAAASAAARAAASAAARDAARADARDAARAAASAAASAAARDAAWADARDAAWDAARADARDAAWDAASAAQRDAFKKIVDGAFEAQALRAKAAQP